MIAKPIRALELHYPIIQFLINLVIFSFVFLFLFPKNYLNEATLHGPFPSCAKPLFPNEGKCEVFHLKKVYFFIQLRFLFNMKNFPLGRMLRVRDFATFKKPVGSKSAVLRSVGPICYRAAAGH